MKNIKSLILIFLMLLIFVPNNIKAEEIITTTAAKSTVNIYLFHSSDCFHCKTEIKFLNSLKDTYNITVYAYEVGHNANNEKIMEAVKSIFGYAGASVPFTVIGNKATPGYAEFMDNNFKKDITEYKSDNKSVLDALKGIPVKKNEIFSNDTIKNVPILGEVNLKTVSLPLITIILGTLDGFNPCAMWVLLFLISMLIGMNDRKKMWVLGLTFLTTSALVYMLVMLAWISLATTFSTVVWLRNVIALVAITGGIINLRSGLKKVDDGCEVVDDKKRKKIFEQVKKFTNEKSFLLAMVGVMALAVSVNVIELACSAGLPLLFSQILAINNLNPIQYFGYTILYIFFFLIDDLIVFTIAMVSFKVTGISTKYGKYSHLIGGILMLIIGALLIFKPEWIMLNF